MSVDLLREDEGDFLREEDDEAPKKNGQLDDSAMSDEVNTENAEEVLQKVKEMQEEAARLKKLQEQLEQDPDAVSPEVVDKRSVYVGNVDYSATPEELQVHFQSCGTINRVTILCDKWTGPKGFAYVEFIDENSVANAVVLNDSLFKGRQIRVQSKRTNIPGLSARGRGRGGYRGGGGGGGYRGGGGGYRPWRGRGGGGWRGRGGYRPY